MRKQQELEIIFRGRLGMENFTHFNIEFGRLIRARRRMFGMTQKDVAQKIGVTFQQLQKYETGETALSVYRLYKISRVLELSFAKYIDDALAQGKRRDLAKK